MNIKVYHTFFINGTGLVFCFSLNENNFQPGYNVNELINTEITVNDKNYTVIKVEKVRTAAPIEWKEQRPVGVIVIEKDDNK